MKPTPFLLSFTQPIHMGALAAAVRVAKRRQATLISLALIPLTANSGIGKPVLSSSQEASQGRGVITHAKFRSVP